MPSNGFYKCFGVTIEQDITPVPGQPRATGLFLARASTPEGLVRYLADETIDGCVGPLVQHMVTMECPGGREPRATKEAAIRDAMVLRTYGSC